MSGIKFDITKSGKVFIRGIKINNRPEKPNAKQVISRFYVSQLRKNIVPWFSFWRKPEPVNYLTKIPFRGINFLSLRSNTRGKCPYWVPRSYVIEKGLQIKKGELGTSVIKKKGNFFCIETFFNLNQLHGIDIPVIEIPERQPPIEKNHALQEVLDYFKFVDLDKFDFKMDDFFLPDDYYYRLFQYFCYYWFCHTENEYCRSKNNFGVCREYKKGIPFAPDHCDKFALIISLGAAFLSFYSGLSTPMYIKEQERKAWSFLLNVNECNLFLAAEIALKMYDEFLKSAEAIRLKKAS
ncbi:MAG: DUF1738 domain-containing protein [Candidatus Aminicenantes bacterium]|nr:DUF1738 domain-containing protein [Candidatus Aminicenantes bacterium]